MQRGDLFWFDADPVLGSEQAGRRPGLIISRDAVNRISPVVVLLPLTTYRGQPLYPSDVLIRAPEGGLSRDSVAMALHLRGIDKRRFRGQLGHIDPATLALVEQAILQLLDIDL
jgi:mRNA interferase MazF